MCMAVDGTQKARISGPMRGQDKDRKGQRCAPGPNKQSCSCQMACYADMYV